MTITDILDECGVDYKQAGEHEHVRAGWIGIDCPSCSPGWHHYRLGIQVQWRRANCWVCGGQNLGRVLHDITGKPWPVVKKWLAELDAGQPSIAEPERRGKLELPGGLVPLLPIHRRYLQGRGFDPDRLTRLYGVQGIGMAAKLAWRLYLPYTLHGTTVSWTTRALDGPGRYVAAEPQQEALNHRHLLFGEDLARHAIIVTEGPLDAVAVGPGGVATSGVQFTPPQIRRIAKYPVRVVLFDNEPAAQAQARKLCDLLAVFDGRTVRAQLDSAKDAADAQLTGAGRRELVQLRRLFLE